LDGSSARLSRRRKGPNSESTRFVFTPARTVVGRRAARRRLFAGGAAEIDVRPGAGAWRGSDGRGEEWVAQDRGCLGGGSLPQPLARLSRGRSKVRGRLLRRVPDRHGG